MRLLRAVDDIMSLLQEATLPSPSSLAHRQTAAQTWMTLSRNYNHGSQLDAMVETLNLIDESVSQARSVQSLRQPISTEWLIRYAQSVASHAAALAINLNDVRLAAILLERGRAKILTHLSRFRQKLNSLQGTAPDTPLYFAERSGLLHDLVLRWEGAPNLVRSSTSLKDLDVG